MRSLALLAAFLAVVGAGSARASFYVEIYLPGGEITVLCSSGDYDFTAPPADRVIDCRSPYRIELRRAGCSNAFTIVDELVITGIRMRGGSLAPGPMAGEVRLGGLDFRHVARGDGTCAFAEQRDLRGAYQGEPGSHNRIVMVFNTIDGGRLDAEGRFFEPPPPGPVDLVFPPHAELTSIRARIDAATASAEADLKFAAGVSGTATNVYVFALAPPERVQGTASTREGGCVLAQLDPASLQLVAVSMQNLRAYYTGIAAAQGQSVNILSNVPFTSVAGASLFVGYGPDAESMVSTARFHNALVLPGQPRCPDQLAFTPGPLSGLWWNSSEPGWGIHLTQRRDIVFAAWYTYDEAGIARWIVSSSCGMAPGSTRESGTCEGAVHEVRARPPGDLRFLSPLTVTPVGSVRITFTSAASASFSYTLKGQSRTVDITRQPISSGALAPATDYTDLWWAQRPGWGIAIAQQYSVMFLAWFVYDSAGQPVWYVASDCRVSGDGDMCAGSLYRTTGPRFGPGFDSSAVRVTEVGSVALRFSGPNQGTLRYDFGSGERSLPITRQVF